MADVKPLDVDQVYHRCSEQDLPFETTAELEPLSEPVGQARLLNALRFATGIENHGFNLFVLGPRGIDSRGFVRRYLKEHAAGRDVPSDWCYVYNFDDANSPRALELEAGDGRRLRDDMEGFIEELEGGIAAVFEGEEYQSRMQDIQEELEQQQREGLSAIGKEARESDIAL
ncbi:MAG TPA: Lon-like protease helical domain-containing protein, partial [Wenzhouxiangella sp.]|nr:Lon-like protease helical domain-containing protein [Wenzhouxiangella sp.]